MRKSPGSAEDPDDMTEAELAEYFYTRRDDLAGEEVSSHRPVRMDVMISVRFSQEEAAELRAAAARAKMSVSALLRQRVLIDPHGRVVDLDKVRAEVETMRARAAKVLQVLQGAETTTRTGATEKADTTTRNEAPAEKPIAKKAEPARKARKSA